MKAQGGFKNKAPAANGAAIIWKKKMKEVKHWKGVRKYDISERMGEGGGFQGYWTLVGDWPLVHLLWEDGGGGGFKVIERW